MAENPLATLLREYEDVGADALTLAGGSVDATEAGLGRLLGWVADAGPWWSFREWTDRMRLAEGIADAEGDAERLVAGRWFGARADLEVWREGDRFRWRVVGDAELSAPAGIDAGDSFFAAAEDGEPLVLRARRERETALLWNRTDARVATASAETLALLPGDGRLRLSYTTYYDRGAVAAVRYRVIEPSSAGESLPTSARGA
jgi:hypothetical protein